MPMITWPVAWLRMAFRRVSGLSASLTAALTITAAPALAAEVTQSWNGYHWARTGELAIGLGTNVSAAWSPYIQAAASQWTAAKNIGFVVTRGQTTSSACSPVYGTVQACNDNYGATGWLGYASVWTSNSFVVEATVKLNEYYFSQPKYNTTAWRQLVACQEIGHTLGLAHADINSGNINLGTCMDYTNDPTGTKGSNGTLANTRPSSSDFSALNGIYAHLDATQLAYTKPTYWSGSGFGIDGRDFDAESALPEPGAWTLIIAGFGLIGNLMRRRARTEKLACSTIF